MENPSVIKKFVSVVSVATLLLALAMFLLLVLDPVVADGEEYIEIVEANKGCGDLSGFLLHVRLYEAVYP